MKKTLSLFAICFCLFFLTSCKKITIINEVINRYVNYEENISILDFEDALVEASKIAQESVVGIKTESGGILLSTSSFGSGVIVKQEELGIDQYKYYVITNRHVVLTDKGNERSIYITLGAEDTYEATIIEYDNNIDIAFVSFVSPRKLPVAKVTTDNIEVGRFVISVGSPYDIDKYYNSVAVGNISHTNRIESEESLDGDKVNNIYIQHNAEVNSGNSGGGLFNIKGELVAINAWKISKEDVEGLAFAIPMHELYEKYNQYFEK